MLVPVMLSYPFVLRATIRGWLRSTPRVRATVPDTAGTSSADPPPLDALP